MKENNNKKELLSIRYFSNEKQIFGIHHFPTRDSNTQFCCQGRLALIYIERRFHTHTYLLVYLTNHLEYLVNHQDTLTVYCVWQISIHCVIFKLRFFSKIGKNFQLKIFLQDYYKQKHEGIFILSVILQLYIENK
jgi:hypothetical protein